MTLGSKGAVRVGMAVTSRATTRNLSTGLIFHGTTRLHAVVRSQPAKVAPSFQMRYIDRGRPLRHD